MNDKELKQLEHLLNKFLFEYGDEISSHKGCVLTKDFTCDVILKHLTELKK